MLKTFKDERTSYTDSQSLYTVKSPVEVKLVPRGFLIRGRCFGALEKTTRGQSTIESKYHRDEIPKEQNTRVVQRFVKLTRCHDRISQTNSVNNETPYSIYLLLHSTVYNDYVYNNIPVIAIEFHGPGHYASI